jgi:hypothetical protein
MTERNRTPALSERSESNGNLLLEKQKADSSRALAAFRAVASGSE